MEITVHQTPHAAASPPSAAAPAAGIASLPREAHLVPAAPFPEDSDTAHSVRQHAVVDAQCRWIIADDDAGADALMCGALQEPRRPFCAAHCARAYLKAPPDEPGEGAEAETAVPAQDDQERGETG